MSGATRFVGRCNCGSVLDTERDSVHQVGRLKGLNRADEWQRRHSELGHAVMSSEEPITESLPPPMEDAVDE